MSKKRKPASINQRDWDAVDSPPLTSEQLSALRPLAEAHPELAEESVRRKRGQRGPQKKPRKVPVTLRVAASTIAAYKAGGRGYQTRMAAVLDKYAR